jgi:hypothetical protein
MNERYYKLANEAWCSVNQRIGFNDAQRRDLFEREFAELIVLECVNAVMDGTKEGDHYAMRIEQHFNNGQGGILHFGVEE